MCFIVIGGSGPAYLSELLHVYTLSHALHSDIVCVYVGGGGGGACMCVPSRSTISGELMLHLPIFKEGEQPA